MFKLILLQLFFLGGIIFFTACGGSNNSNSSNVSNSSSSNSSSPILFKIKSNYWVEVNKSIKLRPQVLQLNNHTIVAYKWTKNSKVLSQSEILEYLPQSLGREKITLTLVDERGSDINQTITLAVIKNISKNLIRNGDFSKGVNSWINNGYYISDETVSYEEGVEVTSDEQQALKLRAVDDAGYYIHMDQELQLDKAYQSFFLSFDWSVTEKEPKYGVNYVHIYFYNEVSKIIGKIVYFDTGTKAHTLEFFKGDLQENQFLGQRKYLEVFSWESVFIDTFFLSGIDMNRVKKIRIRVSIQNDGGAGGEMLVDNFSLQGIDLK